MSAVATPVKSKTKCDDCGGRVIDGTCLNVNCGKAQAAATEDATRSTAKVAVAGATATGKTVSRQKPEPRSFNISGRVD